MKLHPFARRRSDSVAALGEKNLIAAIRSWLGDVAPPTPFGMGDDCALLPAVPSRQLITVDPVIYGRHFDDTVPPRAVGAKLLKRNLSDLAAMGGCPTSAVLSLILGQRVSQGWLEQFHRGLAACARRHGVTIVGGDIAEATGMLAASLTLLGEPAGSRILTRTGSQAGDWIYLTGVVGGSERTGHHHHFIPRLREGAWLAQRPGVRAMMDVSDGLAKDLPNLAPPGTEPALAESSLPRRRGSDVRAALTDGEDYELVFTIARKADRAAFERAWRRSFPRTRLTCIGQFVSIGDRPKTAIRLEKYYGYEHLR